MYKRSRFFLIILSLSLARFALAADASCPIAMAGMAIQKEVNVFEINESALQNSSEFAIEDIFEARVAIATSAYSEILELLDQATQARADAMAIISKISKLDRKVTSEEVESYYAHLAGGGDRDKIGREVQVLSRQGLFGAAMKANEIYFQNFSMPEDRKFSRENVVVLLDHVTFANEDNYLAAYRTVKTPEFKAVVQEEAKRKWKHDPSWQYLF